MEQSVIEITSSEEEGVVTPPESDHPDPEGEEDESSLSDIAFVNEVAHEAIELEQKNLTSLLIEERIRHEEVSKFDSSILDSLDLIGSEGNAKQAEMNKQVRVLLNKRKSMVAIEHNPPIEDERLKMKDNNDNEEVIFEALPAWIQFAVETSVYSVNESTRAKRLAAFEAHHSKLGFFERLHEETIGLLGWLEPSDIEIELRRRAVARVEHVTRLLWPDSNCVVFGSVASGLLLPTGDVDINVTDIPSHEDKINLKLLANHLAQWKLVRCMEVVLSAKVPIIKAIDIVTEYPIDVTINQPSSSETTRFVKRQMKLHPHLRPLILVLKVYLQQRNLAETYHGGIGSYLLFCMCLGFLQQHRMVSEPSLFATITLGHLLFDFFQFYGHDHIYPTMGISVRNGGELYLKKSRNFFQSERPYLLSMQSPLDPSVDVGRNSYNIPIIRDAFKKTYARLCYTYKMWSSGGCTPLTSILQEIIWASDLLFTRTLPLDAIREKIRHYEVRELHALPRDLSAPQASGGDLANSSFQLWLTKGVDFNGVAPYPSRLNHLSHPRPGLLICDQLRQETKAHFHKVGSYPMLFGSPCRSSSTWSSD
eukprot:GHVH01005278.1.p1 GENE.GHVH01005278.1~~GHVH01005278.1.p1  ORF type:complete len:593 (-),score=106.21 GHVH01005278.1:388-2166(-)